jgi:predicted kinase
LIVVSGLPGTGKSSLAAALAQELAATLLAKDVIEAALWRQRVGRAQRSFEISHEIITSLADDALRRGQHTIIDSVATMEDVRRDWRDLARRRGGAFAVIVCVCGDERVHRSRLLDRDRGIAGWPELEWSDVERTARRWEPWTDDHLTVDALHDPRANARIAAEFVRATLDAAPDHGA